MGKILLREERERNFLQKAKEIHGDLFDYSEVVYIDAITPVIIKCNKCGNKNNQVPNNHTSHKKGCSYCKGGVKINQEEFLKRAVKLNGNLYDYSEVVYIDSLTPVIIICKEHKEFKQRPGNHLQGQKCPKCSKSYKLTPEKVFFNLNNIHKDKYDYSESIYINCSIPMIIKCNTCLKKFEQTYSIHSKGHGCSNCRNSKGEDFILNWLCKNEINYTTQYTFNECRGKKKMLPFDFYLKKFI